MLPAILVLCFLGFAFWITWKAFRNGLPVRVKITPHSFEYSIGSKRDNQIDAPPQEGAELNIAVESESDITEIKEQSVDAEGDDV